MLTYNRKATVTEALFYTWKKRGSEFYEFIHVDNGSADGVETMIRDTYNPAISIYNDSNLGVAKGYNRGIVLATGTHIVITGCDRLMPAGWLDTMEMYFRAIPNTGVISIYSKQISTVPERKRGFSTIVNDLPLIECMPMEAKCIRRDVLLKAGHLREDFGLYGWEDTEYAHRLERVCREMGLLSYTIPGLVAEHLGSEGIDQYNGKDDQAYHIFKQAQSNDPAKHRLLEKCAQANYPYYNPYI